uniref:Uncharacterized protein n=1 Tax=Cacopsylla melanoneura TaxID=428564 RepID=A0A8D8SC58_9HEMI
MSIQSIIQSRNKLETLTTQDHKQILEMFITREQGCKQFPKQATTQSHKLILKQIQATIIKEIQDPRLTLAATTTFLSQTMNRVIIQTRIPDTILRDKPQ